MAELGDILFEFGRALVLSRELEMIFHRRAEDAEDVNRATPQDDSGVGR